MPIRENFEKNTYYHIYNRWLRKQKLFHRKHDFTLFMKYMIKYREKCSKDIEVVAYCILPNHFHFVINNKWEGKKISYFIGNICAAYTRYYQQYYGILKWNSYFESRFKAKIIQDTIYLNQCIFYVENNAIKHGLVENVDDWLYRSYSLSIENNEELDMFYDLEK